MVAALVPISARESIPEPRSLYPERTDDAANGPDLEAITTDVEAASTVSQHTAYRAVDVSGVKVFYREAGSPSSPTLVLLHGNPSSSFMFRDLIPRLADRFHLIAPDYPGFGYSDTPPPEVYSYTFDHLACGGGFANGAEWMVQLRAALQVFHCQEYIAACRGLA